MCFCLLEHQQVHPAGTKTPDVLPDVQHPHLRARCCTTSSDTVKKKGSVTARAPPSHLITGLQRRL